MWRRTFSVSRQEKYFDIIHASLFPPWMERSTRYFKVYATERQKDHSSFQYILKRPLQRSFIWTFMFYNLQINYVVLCITQTFCEINAFFIFYMSVKHWSFYAKIDIHRYYLKEIRYTLQMLAPVYKEIRGAYESVHDASFVLLSCMFVSVIFPVHTCLYKLILRLRII